MAVRGVSLAEKYRIILKSDPAHPDNLKTFLEAMGKDKPLTDEQLAKFTGEWKEENGEPTVFLCGPLTLEDRIELGDLDSTMTQSAAGMSMTMRNTERSYKAVRRGVIGVENYTDQDGKAIPYSSETEPTRSGGVRAVASSKFIQSFNKETLFELANEILVQNGMRSSLEKKFESLLSPSPGQASATGDAPKKNAPHTKEKKGAAENPAS